MDLEEALVIISINSLLRNVTDLESYNLLVVVLVTKVMQTSYGACTCVQHIKTLGHGC